MHKSFKVIFLSFLAILFVWACKKDPEEKTITKSQEKRNKLVIDIYDNEIKPKNDSLGIILETLKSTYITYTENREDNIKKNIQEQWLEAAKLVTQCNLFNVTPISRRFYFLNMYSFPISEDFLASYDTTYTNSGLDVSILATNRKGLSMLEYFFYEEDSLHVYDSLVIDYIDNLILYQTKISTYWETELHTDFTTEKTISLNDGFGELLNSYLNVLEVSKKERFDKPFGLHTEEKHTTEAPYSKASNKLFSTSLNYLDYLMTNYYCDFLTCEGEEDLANNIQHAFDNYNNSFAVLNGSTFEEIQTNTITSDLEPIQDDLTEIIKILKVDLSTSYDVLISFSDADGD